MIGCIIQARMGSSRLPGKVLMKSDNGKPLLYYVINQLQYCTKVKNLVIATTKNQEEFVGDFKGLPEDYDKYPYLEASWTVRYNRTMLPNQWNVSCNRHSPSYNKGHHSQIPILRLIRRPESHQYNSHHPLLYFHLQTTFPESGQTAHQT